MFNEIDAHFAESRAERSGTGTTSSRSRRRATASRDWRTSLAGCSRDGMVEYGGLPKVDEAFTDQELRVVDIAECNTNVQEILVASTVINRGLEDGGAAEARRRQPWSSSSTS